MKVIKVAITGGICSGKSTIAKYLGSQESCRYLNLDDFTNIVYFRHPNKLVKLLEKVEKTFNLNDGLLKLNTTWELFDIFKNKDNNKYNQLNNESYFYKEFFNKKQLGKLAFNENLHEFCKNENKSILEIIKAEIVPEIIKIENLALNEIIREEKLNYKINKKENSYINSEDILYVFIEAPTVIESNRTNQYDEVWSCFASEEIIKKRFLERISNQKSCDYNINTLNSIQKNQVSLETRNKHSNVMLSTSDNTENNLLNAFLELKKLKLRFSSL